MWHEAEEFLKKDKYIAPLIQKWGTCGIRKQYKSKYFTDLVDAITSQQLSGKASATIFNRIKNLCAGKITAKKLLKVDTDDLRKCGLSYQKCSYVKDLADKVIKKELQIKKLDELPDKEVISELVAVKGIGRWTAEMFLMFSLARPDVFPTGDLGINKVMERLKLKNSNRWKPYRTVACWYLWRSLENR